MLSAIACRCTVYTQVSKLTKASHLVWLVKYTLYVCIHIKTVVHGISLWLLHSIFGRRESRHGFECKQTANITHLLATIQPRLSASSAWRWNMIAAIGANWRRWGVGKGIYRRIGVCGVRNDPCYGKSKGRIKRDTTCALNCVQRVSVLIGERFMLDF